MARVLIVPCGCRGRALARELRAAGHAVRGTTRGAHVAEIAAAGAEPYVGDPDRIATLMDALHGVTIVCWLMGTIPDPDLHAGRLRMLWEKLVDTPVRGVVYEGMLPRARRSRAPARETWQIPLEVLDGDPLGDGLGRAALRGGGPAPVLSEQVGQDARGGAPDHVAADLVDVGLERHPAPHEALERVAGDEVVERELEHLGDLGLLRDPLEAVLDQPDERIDRVVGDERADGRERADHVDRVRRQPDLLVRLAQRGLQQRLAVVAAPARERDLARVARAGRRGAW